MKTILNLLIYLPILLTSCSTLFEDDVKRSFPAHAKPQLHGALNEAQGIINTVGIHKVKERDVTVEFVPGTRKLKGGWAWQVNGAYYHGLTSYTGDHVKIAHNPANIHDWHVPTGTHEFVHHWLHSNRYYIYHDPVYDKYVNNWANSRRLQGRILGENEILVIDEDGSMWIACPGCKAE